MKINKYFGIMAFLLILLCSIISCKKEQNVNDNFNETNANIEETAFSEEGSSAVKDFASTIYKFGETVAEIEKNLGGLVSKNVSTTENLHNKNQIDDIIELTYEGLFIKIYRTNLDEPKELIMKMIITSDKYITESDIQIGVEKSKVIEILGEPLSVEDTSISYYSGMSGIKIIFVFSEEKVKEIIFECNF